MRQNREYSICKAIATYLRLQYPNVIFHFDYAGLHHTKTQAGQMKAIQGCKGWPDLFITSQKPGSKGLFIEIKKVGTRLYKKDGSPATDHIQDQINCLDKLDSCGYAVTFGIGFDHCKSIIDNYLNDPQTERGENE